MNSQSHDTVKRHLIDPAPRFRDRRNPLPAVFLDRDGVINEEVHYLSRVEDFHLIKGVATAIRRLNEAGIPVIVVTNQSAVARGYITEDQLMDIHKAMVALLAREQASVQGVFYSPYHEKGEGEYRRQSTCRKPEPGMLLAAAEEFAISLPKSVLVGDRVNDVRAGHAAGTRAIMVRTGHGAKETTFAEASEADLITDDLAAAVDEILASMITR
ncbi:MULTISPECIES: D-glycero-alpha-D-manno-heptose-1,7-bisphosphate 7-phosphatase [Thalassospira]|uniref:D,D-heptose 1,7-bisphosphate phosphatase n=2 Tax=Thalassospira TaxID=168934 RepID=A0A367W6P5_9PROT|nr:MULTISPECIES: HAD family hydrolase [Thalassospira]MDG4719202.1 HAD family hydrolase [Thalassospira sp. FZY0004]RCK37124.1 D,D-heptose 1,7-bisphosphate phosphatase [Thalassospira profundimaris]